MVLLNLLKIRMFFHLLQIKCKNHHNIQHHKKAFNKFYNIILNWLITNRILLFKISLIRKNKVKINPKFLMLLLQTKI